MTVDEFVETVLKAKKDKEVSPDKLIDVDKNINILEKMHF